MTAPDLTRITGLLLTKALAPLPELTENGQRWCLSDDGGERAILWHLDSSYGWAKVASVSLTVDVRSRSSVVVGGVVYTGEEGA